MTMDQWNYLFNKILEQIYEQPGALHTKPTPKFPVHILHGALEKGVCERMKF